MTIQMLCVSMDEEIPEVSENVVKAITGGKEVSPEIWVHLDNDLRSIIGIDFYIFIKCLKDFVLCEVHYIFYDLNI